jgi:hypothetical protein
MLPLRWEPFASGTYFTTVVDGVTLLAYRLGEEWRVGERDALFEGATSHGYIFHTDRDVAARAMAAAVKVIRASRVSLPAQEW